MRTSVFLLLLALPAAADIVHLKSGGKVEGRVTVDATTVTIETKNGSVRIPREQVVRIEKKPFDPPGRAERPERKRVRLGPTYANPVHGYRLTLPPRWSRGANQGASAASFYGPRDGFYTPRMDVRIEPAKREFHEHVNAYKEALRKAFLGVEFVSEEASAVRDLLGYRFSVVFSDGDPPLRQQSLFMFLSDGKRIFTLSFNCTKAWFERYAGLVDASMRSLRIYALDGTDPGVRKRFVELYDRGIGYYRQGMLDKALADLGEAARIMPGFGDLHLTLGTIHLRKGDYAAAEKAYRRGLAIDAADARSHYNLGLSLLRQFKYPEAAASLEKAAALEPATEPTLTNLGVAYLGQDLADPAREVLEKAVFADPESVQAHYNLGLAYERLERTADAAREYGEALKLDPRHEEAKKGLARARR